MLDQLESAVSAGTHRSTASSYLWPLLIALCVATLAAIWGWSHQRAANPSVFSGGTAAPVLDLALAAERPQLAASSNPTPTIAAVAHIETLLEDSRMQAESSPESAETVADPDTPAPTQVASTAPQVAEMSGTTTEAVQPPSRARPLALPEGAKETVAAARLRPVAADSTSTARARPRSRDIPPSARSAGRPDADVVLLTALLDHVSNEGRGTPLASPSQATLAQIVRRCESRSGRSTAQARECLRRICEGYWGKAEACPLGLAPEKKS